MGRLHSIYDDVGNGIKEKVFVLRGDEAYARSTNTVVTVDSTFDESNVEYFTTDVSVEVLRSLGTAPVYLFRDDEQEIGEWNVTRFQHEFTLEDAQFEYGNDIKLYAKFMGNKECIFSKSKPIIIHRDIPATHKTNIEVDVDSQISSIEDCYVTVSLSIGDSTTASALHNRDIRILVDGSYVETITTGDDNYYASTTLTGLTNGIHTITAEVDRASNINSGSGSATVMKGYKLLITDYPSKFIDGKVNVVTISLTNYQNVPIPNATIIFNSTEYTTDTNGIATCNVTDITTGTYHAVYGGSVSNDINVVVSYPSGITITHRDNRPFIGFKGISVPLVITVGGDDVSNIPITITDDTTKTLTTDYNGRVTYDYVCDGVGDITVTALTSNLMNTITIEDCEIYANTTGMNATSKIKREGSSIVKYNSYYSVTRRSGQDTCMLKFPYESTQNYPNYSLEFKLAQDIGTDSCRLYVQDSDYITLDIARWKKGAVVKLLVEDNQLKQYVNNKLITTGTITGRKYNVKFWDLTFGGNKFEVLAFSELKFKRE